MLPCQAIRALVAEGSVAADTPVEPGQVQPASLDLRLGDRALRMRASFLPGAGRSVAERTDLAMHEMSLEGGAVLERGCVYLVPLRERLALPRGLHAVANAKSSTGRVDLLTRLITDGGDEFDRIAEGYDGPLWAEICPRSFSVLVRPGMRLNQIRFRRGETRLADARAARAARGAPTRDGPRTDRRWPGLLGRSGAARLGIDAGGGIVGWRAKPHAGVVDLGRVGHHPARDFWEALAPEGGRLILDPGAFYILVSREAVHIPPSHAAEMAPYLAMVGEFRVHYAGFFDPGFGHGPSGAGARGVLEVRCHEAPFALEHGQTVGRLIYERMAEPPDALYGATAASSYQGQGLKLSKHFA